MTITVEQVDDIAQLAMLAIDEQHKQQYADELSKILDYVQQMDSVNTDNLEPLANPLDAVQRLRTDAVTETNQRELFQANHPYVEQGLYLVPKVIEDK